MKKIVASAWITLLLIQPLTVHAAFTDTDDQYADTIEYLEQKGIIQGYAEGDFRAKQPVTRAEFFKMLLANSQFDPAQITEYHMPFTDVATTDWFAPYLEKAWEMGLLEDGLIADPHGTLTRVEATRILLNMLGIPIPRLVPEEEWSLEFNDVRFDIWYAPIVLYGTNYSLIDPLDPEDPQYFRPLKKLTRGEATKLLYNMDVFLYGSQIVSDYADLETALFGELDYDIPHLDIFADVWTRIHEEYYGRDDVDDEQLIYNAIQGMVEGLGDAHTVFFDPPDAQVFDDYLEGQLSGIGAQLVETEDGAVVIQNFISESPAETSGLKVNDRITAVDGVDVTKSSIVDIVNLIRGEADTEVSITVDRESEDEPLTFTITRAVLDISYLSGEVMGDALYIDMNLFDSLAFIEFPQKVRELAEENPDFKGFLIDLRDNPGGYLDGVHSIIGHFIPNNYTAFHIKTGEDETVVYLSSGQGEWKDYPIVFLVNEGTASASEIMAITLKERLGASIVGKPTYGKGTVQQVIDYGDGSSLKLTIAEWLSPEFHSINGIGITPHFDVDLTVDDLLAGKDPQLEKGLEVLQAEMDAWEAAGFPEKEID